MLINAARLRRHCFLLLTPCLVSSRSTHCRPFPPPCGPKNGVLQHGLAPEVNKGDKEDSGKSQRHLSLLQAQPQDLSTCSHASLMPALQPPCLNLAETSLPPLHEVKTSCPAPKAHSPPCISILNLPSRSHLLFPQHTHTLFSASVSLHQLFS